MEESIIEEREKDNTLLKVSKRRQLLLYLQFHVTSPNMADMEMVAFGMLFTS